jgi:hypothetical protein
MKGKKHPRTQRLEKAVGFELRRRGLSLEDLGAINKAFIEARTKEAAWKAVKQYKRMLACIDKGGE